MGSSSYVEHVKALVGLRAKGRDVTGRAEGYHQLREGGVLPIRLFSGAKKKI
jgi:hypothetical protein